MLLIICRKVNQRDLPDVHIALSSPGKVNTYSRSSHKACVLEQIKERDRLYNKGKMPAGVPLHGLQVARSGICNCILVCAKPGKHACLTYGLHSKDAAGAPVAI